MDNLLDDCLALIARGNLVSLIALAVGLHLFRRVITDESAATARVVRTIGVIVFLTYLAHAVGQHGLRNADRLFEDCFRGGVATAIVISVGWLVVPVVTSVVSRCLSNLKRMGRMARPKPRPIENRPAPQPTFVRQPEVVPLTTTLVAKDHEVETKRADEQRRRESARLSCLMKWDEAASALAGRFPRERMLEYFDSYMTERHSVEDVEARATQMLALLKSILRSCNATNALQFESITALLAHFDALKAEIAASNADRFVVDALISTTNSEQIRAIEEYLKR